MCYLELNALQQEFREVGFTILGFPCNQFGMQEPGKKNEILSGLKWVLLFFGKHFIVVMEPVLLFTTTIINVFLKKYLDENDLHS